jgi:excisionase family DNA binding protein
MNKPTLYSTAEVARILGVSRRRVLALIKAGRLPAQKISGVQVVESSSIMAVWHRKPGRPKKK